MPTMPLKKARQTATTMRLLFFLTGLISPLIAASHQIRGHHARGMVAEADDGGDVEDDDERRQRHADGDRAVAPRLLLAFGQSHQFEVLVGHDHALPMMRARPTTLSTR